MRWLMLVILLAFGLTAAGAQSLPPDEETFWARIRQTERLLRDIPADEAARETLAAQVDTLWTEVDAVLLEDGSTLPLDLAWLTPAPRDEAGLQTLYERVAALLDAYRSGQAGEATPSLAALDEALRDPRFTYTESETPEWELPDLSVPTIAPVLAQVALALLGIAVVVWLLLRFARGLQTQGAQLAPAEGADPTTSTAARELAASSEELGDYRRAIRYLYLASLLLLDERGLIRYDPALTNREHLRQLRDKPEVLAHLRPVVNTFDRVWYGFAPVDATLYDQFRSEVEALQGLHAQVEQGARR